MRSHFFIGGHYKTKTLSRFAVLIQSLNLRVSSALLWQHYFPLSDVILENKIDSQNEWYFPQNHSKKSLRETTFVFQLYACIHMSCDERYAKNSTLGIVLLVFRNIWKDECMSGKNFSHFELAFWFSKRAALSKESMLSSEKQWWAGSTLVNLYYSFLLEATTTKSFSGNCQIFKFRMVLNDALDWSLF